MANRRSRPMNQAKYDLNAKSTRSKPSPTGTCRKVSCLPPDGKKERPVPGRPAWLAARHDIEYPLIRSGMKAPEAQARIDARVAAFDIRLDLRQHLCDFARASGNSRPSCAPWRQKGHCWAPIDGPRWPGSRPGRIPGCRTLQSQRHGVHAHCSPSTPPPFVLEDAVSPTGALALAKCRLMAVRSSPQLCASCTASASNCR